MKIISIAALCSIASFACPSWAQAEESPQTLIEACWQQSFVDDFVALDLWDAQTGEGQWKTSYIWDRSVIINNEMQYYVDPTTQAFNPFRIDNGVLHITADRTPENLLSDVAEQPYVSGVLTTQKGFSQKYGRFEALAKVPLGKGLWSAFWLLPSFEQWPQGVAVLPEIDVMENLGHEPNTFHTTLHTNQNGKLESHPKDHTIRSRLSDNFHLYSVVWSEEKVDWYFDKKWVASYPTPKDFTEPVHFLLNLAVGGTWPGSPDDSTRFPATYSIDYVRAFVDSGAC